MAAPGRALGESWHWVGDARRGVSSARGWLGASGPWEILAGSEQRDAGGAMGAGQQLAGPPRAPASSWLGTRLLTAGLSWSFSRILLWERAAVGRMGLPPRLHPSPAAGQWHGTAALPCSPISPHPSITAWLSGKVLSPPRWGLPLWPVPAAAPAQALANPPEAVRRAGAPVGLQGNCFIPCSLLALHRLLSKNLCY